MTKRRHVAAQGWGVDPAGAKAVGAVVLGAAVAGGAAVAADWVLARGGQSRRRELDDVWSAAGRSARQLHGSAALLSASVLADSAVEHYRGGFDNPGMYTPLLVSALSLLAGGDGATARLTPPRVRTGAFGLAAAVGMAGLGFHAFNVLRKPGGLSWLNAFYAAPLGAPAALTLAGAMGLAARRVERAPAAGSPPRILGLPAGRVLAGLTGAGLLGTVGEAALLHFRGAFQNPFMYLPVSLPPVAAALMARAALEPDAAAGHPRPLTRFWLGLTAVLGVAGVGFHVFGVSRAMGGWRNWTQNVVDGPPIPAPPLSRPAFSALALRDREMAERFPGYGLSRRRIPRRRAGRC